MQSGIAGQVLIGQRSSAGPSNAAPREAPLIGRFVAKLVVDVLPAALASLVGGFLFTQYQHARTVAAQPTTEQVTPASPEMMRLVRDEHDAIIDYLKAQTALEKSRATAAEEVDDVHAAADAKAAAAATAAAGRRAAQVVSAPKPVTHSKPIVATLQAPVAMAQVVYAPPPSATVIAAPALAVAVPAPPPSNSLLAKTIDIKDHVLHATFHAVSMIGGIPNWIASIGDRIGGNNTDAPPSPRQFSTSS